LIFSFVDHKHHITSNDGLERALSTLLHELLRADRSIRQLKVTRAADLHATSHHPHDAGQTAILSAHNKTKPIDYTFLLIEH
jgi:hypothetical protein